MKPSALLSGASPSRHACSTARADLERPQQAAVQVLRQGAVEQPVLALLHRVLVVAEPGSASATNRSSAAQRVGPGDREPERLEVAEMVAEARAHERPAPRA